MPSKDNVVNQGEDLDFDPGFDHLFYSTGLDNCLFDKSNYCSMFTQVGDQDLWKNHSTNKCQTSFYDGMTRAWSEGKTEVKELKQNLRNILNKNVNEEVSKHDIFELFYGKDSKAVHSFPWQYTMVSYKVPNFYNDVR